MAHRRNTNTPTFSPAITWLGILLLGSSLTTVAVPPATATSTAISTSSIAWPTARFADGVTSGGAPVDYATGIEGWGAAPFSTLGLAGLEWASTMNPARREPYFGALQSSSLIPGGVSSWRSAGLLSPRPEQNFYLDIITRAEHNHMDWTIRLESLDEDVMTENRFFWIADLAPGFQATYSSPGPGQLVISDSSNTYPTLVFRATTNAGTLTWGGSGIYTAPLANGEADPTLYVYGTSAMDITINISLGIIDHDPCSTATAKDFAMANAASPPTAWPVITECMGDASWSVQAATSQSVIIPLDPATPSLGPGQQRTLSVSGLPDGATWEALPDTAEGLSLRIQADAALVPGDYSLGLHAITETTTGGVVTRSQPLESQATLRIEPAPVIVVVEPEAEPEPEPVPDPEPEPVPEPEPEPEPDPEPVEEPVVVEPEIPEAEEELPVLEISESETAVEGVSVPSVEPEPAAAAPAPPVQVETEPATVRVRQVPLEPEEEVVVTPPAEISLEPRPPRTITMPPLVGPPEPSFAQAWVGLSLMITLATGSLVAAIRRWRNQQEE